MEWYKEGYDLPEEQINRINNKNSKSNNKMKTVLVVFTKSTDFTVGGIGKSKQYPFNTEDPLEAGDYIESPKYKGNYLLVVQELAGEAYTHSDRKGELYRETNEFKIRTLINIKDDEKIPFGLLFDEDEVYYRLVK